VITHDLNMEINKYLSVSIKDISLVMKTPKLTFKRDFQRAASRLLKCPQRGFKKQAVERRILWPCLGVCISLKRITRVQYSTCIDKAV
jgi:hypothetical protein